MPATLPAGFVIDVPVTSGLPEGFVIDVPAGGMPTATAATVAEDKRFLDGLEARPDVFSGVAPSYSWWDAKVAGPASLLPAVVPEYLKLTAAAAMKFAGQGLQGLQGLLDNDPIVKAVNGSGKPILAGDIKSAGDWLVEHSKEMKDWADKEIVGASPLGAGAAEMVGTIAGFASVAAANKNVATAFFAAGTGEELAQGAEKAGRSPEEIAHARVVGSALGLAAAEVPVGRLSELLKGWNVNPYVKELAGGLTAVLGQADTRKRLLASGIEAIKSGMMGAATGAGYRVGMNAATNKFTGSNTPLLEGAGADAAMFGLPMAAGGAAAMWGRTGGAPMFVRTDPTTGKSHGIPFNDAVDVFAKRAAGYVVKPEGAKPEGPKPETRNLKPEGPEVPGGMAETEFLAKAAEAKTVPGEGTGKSGIGNPVEPVTVSAVEGIPTVEFPVAELKLSRDVPNFKENADPETGVVSGEQLGGKPDRRGMGPIVAWQRLNGDNEVISGRHRLDLFRRAGETTIPTQIFKESDGFGKQDALTLDAELNIRDGQGKVKDYADYFRNGQMAESEAASRGLLSRAKGRAGFAIGKGGSDDLYALYAAGKLPEAKAVAIAAAAPGNAGLQRAGIARAQNMSAAELPGFLAMLQRSTGPQEQQAGLFGDDDAALIESERITKAAAARVSAISDQLAAVRGAAKRPEAAAKLGVDVRDPQGILSRIAELEAEREKYASFWQHPNVMAELGGKSHGVQEAPNVASNGEGQLFNNSDLPFNLQGETDLTPELQRIADEEAKAEAQRKAQDAAQMKMFEQSGNYALDSVDGEKYREIDGLLGGVDPLPFITEKPNEYQLAFNFDSQGQGGEILAGGDGGLLGARKGQRSALGRTARILGLAIQSFKPARAGSLLGRKVTSPESVAVISQIYRDPRFETFRTYFLAADGKILHETAVSSRLAASTTIMPEGKDFKDYVKFVRDTMAATGAKYFANIHNHPSGDPEPSGLSNGLGDMQLVHSCANEFTGGEFYGHVIINSGKYSVIDESGTYLGMADLPGHTVDALLQPSVPHMALGQIVNEYYKMAAVAKMVEVAPDVFTIIGLDNELKVRAVVSVDNSMLENPKRLAGLLGRIAHTTGTRFPVIAGISDELMVLHRQMAEDAVREGFLFDVVTTSGRSLHTSRLPLKQMGRDGGKGNLFYDEPAKYQPATPASVSIEGKWVPKDMAHMESIKPVGMPELVKLARELTGKLPELKRMRKYRGLAYHAEGTMAASKIVLDPRIFIDPMQAAKTLAHEVGHIEDFVDDLTMLRGNILGRLGVLKEFLASTLPIDPAAGTESLSAKDRGKIRREVEREVGGRPAKDEEADLAAWQEEVRVRYAEAIQQEIEARGLAYAGSRDYLPNVREELIALTDWWNPFLENADKLPPSYLAYRTSSKELYAEMISVLLNNPEALKQRAPVAWEMFFNHLDRKPEAKRGLFELWDWMNKPEYARLAERRAGVLGMFKSGAELMARKIADRERLWTIEGFTDGLRTFLDTRYWPAIKRERAAAARGDVRAGQNLLEWMFDAHPLADNQVFLWLNGVQDRVRGPLLEAELTEESLGEFLLWDRIANERYEVTENIGHGMNVIVGEAGRATIANPRGHTPETAIAQIGHMEEELGEVKFARLRELAAAFHDEFFKLTEAMNAEGMIPPETWDIVQGNKDHYAAFVPLEYVDTFVSAAIRKQIGTLKDIQNPYVSTVLKGITTIRAIELNRAKRMTLDGLRAMFPQEITPATMAFDGKRQVPVRPKDPELDLMTVAVDGKRVSYNVPGDIVEMFEREDHSLLTQVAGPLDYLWRNVFYPIFITYNPVFQFIRNPIRDTRRTSLNLPHGVGVEQAAIMRITNAKAVRAFVESGTISPEIGAALEARAIAPPMGTWQATSGTVDEFTAIARRFGLAPEVKGVWDRSALLRPLAALGERIRIAGQVRELVPKVGTFRILTSQLGWGPEEAAYYVRNHIGTPNYTKQGTVTRVANDIFPFTNVFLKGWQSDLRLMRKGFAGKAGGKQRKSAASWWLRWMLTSGSLRVLQAAGAAGVLGVGIKKLYDRVGDYYMSNYDVLPIGETDGGAFDGQKTTMVILPRDPTDRILGAMTYQFSKAIFDTAMGKPANPAELVPKGFSFVSSDVPGLNPAIKLANGWASYVQGKNPYDTFRSANVLTDQEKRAGGWPAVKTMLAWSLGQTGLNNFIQYDPSSGSSLEIGLGVIPGINGLVRVTDNGLREKLSADDMHKHQIRDRAALAMPGMVRELRQEYNFLSSVGSKGRSPVMEARYQTLAGWNTGIYEPFVEAAMAMPAAQGRMGEMAAKASKPFKRAAK